MNMKTGSANEATPLINWAAAYLERSRVAKAHLNAQQLLAHCTGRSRVDLYAYPDKKVSEEETQAFFLAVQRRALREPLQYIVGTKGFRYLELAVDRRVLIPRPETEMLVESVIGLIDAVRGHPVVVDVGTGSGCIALSVCRECPASVVHATDISGQALAVAKHNARRLGLDGCLHFHEGDLLDALPEYLVGKCDFIVSNPPYIREKDYASLPPEVREHEPYRSLVAGPSGWELHLRLTGQAHRWLSPRGWLFMEGGEDQLDFLQQMALDSGYDEARISADLNGRPRIIAMRSPSPAPGVSP
jgi:release factor glutamine methyltransferase